MVQCTDVELNQLDHHNTHVSFHPICTRSSEKFVREFRFFGFLSSVFVFV